MHETQPDWLNEEIKSAIITRDAYHKHKNWSQYKIWRNKTTTFIRKAEKELFSKSVAENKTDSFLWQHIKNLKESTCGDSLPQTIKVNNRQTDAAPDIIDELNTYFSSISDKLKSKYGHDDIPYNF